MNTEAKAIHDAVGPSQRSAAEQQTYNYDSNKEKLLADLKVVVADAQQLIKEVADSSSAGFATLRTRFEEKLRDATAKIDRTRATVLERTQLATDATHAYVKENPWKSVGVSAVAGVIFGLLLGRRH